MIELTRAFRDRRLYRLDGVGTLRLEGFFTRGAVAEAGESTWYFGLRRFWQRNIEATDAAGTAVGGFAPRDFRRGGGLRWGKASSRCTRSAPCASATS